MAACKSQSQRGTARCAGVSRAVRAAQYTHSLLRRGRQNPAHGLARRPTKHRQPPTSASRIRTRKAQSPGDSACSALESSSAIFRQQRQSRPPRHMHHKPLQAKAQALHNSPSHPTLHHLSKVCLREILLYVHMTVMPTAHLRNMSGSAGHGLAQHGSACFSCVAWWGASSPDLRAHLVDLMHSLPPAGVSGRRRRSRYQVRPVCTICTPPSPAQQPGSAPSRTQRGKRPREATEVRCITL